MQSNASKGFFLKTKGKTCGNLRPIQSLSWKFTKGKLKVLLQLPLLCKVFRLLSEIQYIMYDSNVIISNVNTYIPIKPLQSNFC